MQCQSGRSATTEDHGAGRLRRPDPALDRKEATMKTLLTTIVLATGSVGSFAAEYTNFELSPGMSTRAEMRAPTSDPQMRSMPSSPTFAGEYTHFDVPSGMLTRAEVRAAIATPDASGIAYVGDAAQFALPNTRTASFPSNVVPGRA